MSDEPAEMVDVHYLDGNVEVAFFDNGVVRLRQPVESRAGTVYLGPDAAEDVQRLVAERL